MERARRLTLGGIKVERPRRQMKLMVKISYCYHKLLFLLNTGVFNELDLVQEVRYEQGAGIIT